MKKKKPAAAKSPPSSPKLAVAERRAFIWANPRAQSKGEPGPYYLCSRTPTEEEPMTDEDIALEKYGVKAAFDYLYGHANIERTPHGFWAVGHSAEDTRLILETIEEVAHYSEVLRGLYLSRDAGLCPGCGEPLDEHERATKPKVLPAPNRTH